MSSAPAELPDETVEIRVRGTVQGVGFRPTVWRLARHQGLAGEVFNDAAGVLIRMTGTADSIAGFVDRLRSEAPPLSRIESIEVYRTDEVRRYDGFAIAPSIGGENLTRVTPDAATCPACRAEVLNPSARRHRYPFTNCTHCGPRLSIVQTVPYDRANTTMSVFPMCADCAAEYDDPADRRFHAQPIACPECGPGIWLEGPEGRRIPPGAGCSDVVHQVADLLGDGRIIGIRGLGGFHLACEAGNASAIETLRRCKHRYGKPFALMARDVETVRRFCTVTPIEEALLNSPEAPIVLLRADGPESLPEAIAPGLRVLGFMLPYTPLHLLILDHLDGPLVMTSGNLSSEPQITGNDQARARLFAVADALLLHDREIANRVDDSVVRVVGEKPRLLRRARGYAPSAIALPEGFEAPPDLLAYGGELKSTFCVVKAGSAIVSQHQGDLEEVTTFEDYRHNLRLYTALYDHRPALLAADRHPEYLSTKLAEQDAVTADIPLVTIQHHHAHVASCLAENGVPLASGPVLGVALDGLGFGDDGTFWGGEFLLAGYQDFLRLASLKPVPMIGGIQAIHQPWRNTYAHLQQAFEWSSLVDRFPDLDLWRFLRTRPLAAVDSMLRNGINVPLASSCGRLFDGVSAALGLCPEHALFEGQGAMELEALADEGLRRSPCARAYPFRLEPARATLFHIDPAPMWEALLADLVARTDLTTIAARFHLGLAGAIGETVARLRRHHGGFDTVALTGGCFQNRLLLELALRAIESLELKCLTHSRLPSNDGGLALGQAAVAAARYLRSKPM